MLEIQIQDIITALPSRRHHRIAETRKEFEGRLTLVVFPLCVQQRKDLRMLLEILVLPYWNRVPLYRIMW